MFAPTAHTAKPAVAPKTGRFATLRGPRHAEGSGAPTRGLAATAAPFMARSLIAVCALLALFALSAGIGTAVATAAAPPLVGDGNFESVGASGIAVDQSSGDVFAMGFLGITQTGPHQEEVELGPSNKFDASGKLLSPPSPFAPGTFNSGAAVNPANGHLYVASLFEGIDIYDPTTGALLSSFSVPFLGAAQNPLEPGGVPAQIATDSAGDVYVPDAPENKVLEYNEEGHPLETFTGSEGHALKGPTGVAVASSGNVWVADAGDNRIEEFSPTGAFLGDFKSEGVRALALYEHEGVLDVLAIVDNGADSCAPVASPCEHLVEYDSSGARLGDFGAGDFGDHFGETTLAESMVAVDESSGRVYVSDGLKNVVWVYQPPVAPVLGQESAVEVGASEANLGVLVAPGGVQATYRIEYDTREYKQGEGPHGVSVPSPEGSAGEGFSSRTVWASARGLTPGTTYYYRAVVTNGVGTVLGPEQTFTTETLAQASCPNEAARGGFSATLPDCRAYELVTPAGDTSAQPDTGHTEHGIDEGGGAAGNSAASDGDRFSFVSLEVMPGSQSAGLEFVSVRGTDGWSIEDALPLQPYTGDRCTIKEQSAVVRYSADLSKSVVVVNNKAVGTTAGFSEGCRGEVREVVAGEPLGEENLLLRDNSDGGSYQLINLTPAGVTPTEPSLVGASADLSLIVFSERAKLTPEALNNTENLYEWREGVVRLLQFKLPSGAPVAGSLVSISNDGSEVFFTAEGNLYVRLNGGERTVQLDEARGGAGPGGGGKFAAVTADGSKVFFTDNATAGLTSDTVPGSGTNLYGYDVSTDQLSDLTPVSGAEAALTGIGEDGSYVYFTAKGVLSGSQANQFGETAESGKANLYLDHGGTITFVMYGGGTISANGAFLAFDSASEIYLYSAASNRVQCASCNPDGEAPKGGVVLGARPHFVSDNGQVFFETAEALLPADTNGIQDVYEFDYESGLHLISTGTSSSESFLLEASPSGDDVFFLTRQQLLAGGSSQEANVIYDARVDGGFPESTLPPACATADACRSASALQPAIYGAPSSQTFAGAGNLAPPPPPTGTSKSLSRAQMLAKALRTCRAKKKKKARISCEKQAQAKYGSKVRAKKASTDRRAAR